MAEVKDDKEPYQDLSSKTTLPHIQAYIDAFDNNEASKEVINACVVTTIEEDWFLD